MYSNERLQLAANRQSVEMMNRQLLGVDVMEISSPERESAGCAKNTDSTKDRPVRMDFEPT